MKLSDEVIAHIAKQLQMAILTGTDVVDNLRLIKLHESAGKVYLAPEYAAHTAENENKMVETAQILSGHQDKENE
jgi:hypothetical protein